MIILLSWLKDFIDSKGISHLEIADKLTNIGLEVDGITEYTTVDNDFEGLVVGEILECVKHPNADRLHCTKVDIGGDKILSIVCGAPNVRIGIKVVVALENSRLQQFSGENFKIKKSKIRGEISEGMLCAEDEIGISEKHDKIIELDLKYKNGTRISEIYGKKCEKDHLIDINLTPNRGYAACYLNVARDLKTVLGKEIYKIENKNTCIEKLDDDVLNIEIENKEICNRYCGILIRNVRIKESPEKIKERLRAVKIKHVNNVVDITNYVMMECGQPMHVYDFRKISGRKIGIKESKNEEKIIALDKKEYGLNGDIVICDNEKILGIAGIIGGLDSAVDEETTDIFFESANFNSKKIRKSVNKLKIKTEASYRFERGIDESSCFEAIYRALDLLKEQQNDIEIEGYVDINNVVKDEKIIKTSYERICKIIGKIIDVDTIDNILKNLDCKVKKNGNSIEIKVPKYRKNIECEGDIVDEILRVYGYENLSLKDYKKERFYVENNCTECEFYCEKRDEISNLLCSNGFFEIDTCPLIAKKSLFENKNNEIEILNAENNKFNILRTNLIYSDLDVIKYNINRGNKDLKMFNFGKIYYKENNKYVETEHLGIYLVGEKEKFWKRENMKYDFFDLKQIFFNIINFYRIENVEISERENDFVDGIEIKINKEKIGYLGILKQNILTRNRCEYDILYCDIDFEKLARIVKVNKKIEYKEILKFNTIQRDLSLIIGKNTKYSQIEDVIKNYCDKRIVDVVLFSVYEDKSLENKKKYSIKIFIQDENKTLSSSEIQEIIDSTIKILENKINAMLKLLV